MNLELVVIRDGLIAGLAVLGFCVPASVALLIIRICWNASKDNRMKVPEKPL